MPKRRAPDAGTSSPGPTPPPGLSLSTIESGGESLVVLSFDAPSPPAVLPPLGEVERAVLSMLLAGHSNEEIARHRGRSVRTVANQVRRLFEKFGVSSRASLAAVVQGARKA